MTSSPRPMFLFIAFMLACFALAACSPSVAAGSMTGGSIALLLLGMLLAGGMTTQAGCIDDSGKDVDMGPCLSVIREDMERDMEIGPCLSPPLDMSNERDMEVGPCLSPLPPDMGIEQDMKRDMEIGPCLSPPLDMGNLSDELVPSTPPGEHTSPRSPEQERQQLLAKLADRLPADVVAKLGGHGSDKV